MNMCVYTNDRTVLTNATRPHPPHQPTHDSEKIKKQLWDAECAISEQRLKDLRTLLETRQLELADGRRLTDDRLAAYKDRLAPLLVPRAPEPAPPPFVPRPREKKAAAAAASEPTRASQRLKPELTVTIPPPTLAGRTTRSRTPQGGGAGAGSGPDTTTTSASAATTAGAASGGMVDLTGAPSGMSNPPPSDALDASAAGARGKRKRGPTPPPSALAEQPQPAPSAAKLGGAGGRRKAAAVKGEAGTEVMVEEDGAEGNPAEGPAGGAAAAPKGKGKAAAAAAAPASASAPVEVQEEEEEEELLGFKSARDRFDELSEQAGLEAAAALSGEGPGVWAAGARRVAVGGCAVDFEKSVALVLDPEAEMRRREGAAAAGAVGGGVGGSHKRQRWVWCVDNVCWVCLIVACDGA